MGGRRHHRDHHPVPCSFPRRGPRALGGGRPREGNPYERRQFRDSQVLSPRPSRGNPDLELRFGHQVRDGLSGHRRLNKNNNICIVIHTTTTTTTTTTPFLHFYTLFHNNTSSPNNKKLKITF